MKKIFVPLIFFFLFVLLFFPAKTNAQCSGACEIQTGTSHNPHSAWVETGCNGGYYTCQGGWVDVGCREERCQGGWVAPWCPSGNPDDLCAGNEWSDCASTVCVSREYGWDGCAWESWTCTSPQYTYYNPYYWTDDPVCTYQCNDNQSCVNNSCINNAPSCDPVTHGEDCGYGTQCCDPYGGGACSSGGRICINTADPTPGASCNPASCPNKSVLEQCGADVACSVGKGCYNNTCIYSCDGKPPCGGSGGGPTATIPPGYTPAPTPLLYPTSTVQGNLIQQNGRTDPSQCVVYSGSAPTINLTPQTSTDGVTVNCTPSGATYTCNISYNNQVYPGIPTSQSFSLSASSQSGNGNWHTANQCLGTVVNTLTVANGQTYTNASSDTDIFFYVSPWIKAVNTSLHTAGISFNVPFGVTAFDSDDPGNRVVVDGESGLISSSTSLPSSSQAPLSSKSPDDWKIESYPYSKTYTFDTFYSYIQARKLYKIITNLSEINTETGYNIFFYDATASPLSLSTIPTRDVVLLVRGNVDIPDNIDLAVGNGFALISSGTITVGNDVSLIEGVYSSALFDTGINETLGLKIKGNLATDSLSNQRSQSNNSKPSLLIVHDPAIFVELLPYLSTAGYQWSQVQ